MRDNQFKKDVKRLQRRGKDLTKLKAVIEALAAAEALSARHQDHPLQGTLKDAGNVMSRGTGC